MSTLLIPQPRVEEVHVITEAEAADVNTERFKLVKKLLTEVKETSCPVCLTPEFKKVEEDIEGIEKKVITYERVAKLRENLKQILEEVRGDIPLAVIEEKVPVETKGSEPEAVSARPESGRTYPEQSGEGYCVECIESHTMKSLTELRHAIDRYRTAGKMTEGVTEKVRVALGELQGIDEDVKSTKGASPKMKEGLDEILDRARWLRKEFGLGGRALTAGKGEMQDLEQLQTEISGMQAKAYRLVAQCPTCLRRIK